MPNYHVPLRDIQFVLHETLNLCELTKYEQFNELDEDLINDILAEGAKFAEQVLTPLNLVGDQEGCTRHEDGAVTTPTGFKEAYDTLVGNGWTSLVHSLEHGGQGLPDVLGVVVNEMFTSANSSFTTYPGLTSGAIKAISIGGSLEQKQTYLPKMISGEWAGTMNLTEPHCGTDLGMMKTKAEKQEDGSYRITGQKIFITAGEHDLTDNIIHLVLARTQGAPPGVKGISLYVVPKFMLKEDGEPGARNGVSCGALEEKMGIHGSATCVMNYDDAVGYLVGEENKGLNVMFIMMNAARINVGMQAYSQSEVAYQNAVTYATERLQGRAVTGVQNPDGPADPLIVHPDVRRMLMDTKSFNEAARMLAYWTALSGDIESVSDDESVRNHANDLLELLTPVVKGYLSDIALKATVDCQQIFGGHGYIEEWGMSQFVRDTRITALYEGANGIQALDLVGRKLAQNNGRALMTLNAELDSFLEANKGNEKIAEFTAGLEDAKSKLTDGTMWLMQHGLSNPNNAAAGSVDYMHMMGLLVLTYMWAKMAATAQGAIDSGKKDEFYKTKLITGRYFIARVLPMIDTHLARLKTGADPVMALDAESF